jgi:hypothetical protein
MDNKCANASITGVNLRIIDERFGGCFNSLSVVKAGKIVVILSLVSIVLNSLKF